MFTRQLIKSSRTFLPYTFNIRLEWAIRSLREVVLVVQVIDVLRVHLCLVLKLLDLVFERVVTVLTLGIPTGIIRESNPALSAERPLPVPPGKVRLCVQCLVCVHHCMGSALAP